MLVLRILPFWADALLEEMVVGLQSELGDGSNVVLRVEELRLVDILVLCLLVWNEGAAGSWWHSRRRRVEETYISAPELLDAGNGDDLLEKLVPVVPLAG